MLEYALASPPKHEELKTILFFIDAFDMARRELRDAVIPVFPLEIAIVKCTQFCGELLSQNRLKKCQNEEEKK